MPNIYHYTSLDAFVSILKNKKLWLSGSQNLNDHQEMEWGLGKIRDSLKRRRTPQNDNHVNDLWKLLEAYIPPYVCSFSMDGGDQLSQWRAYACDGTGVAIGFNLNSLPVTSTLPYQSDALEHCITTFDVIYQNNMQDERIDKAVDRLMTYVSNQNNNHDIGVIDRAASHLYGLAAVFKNPAFEEEREWRIVHTPTITSDRDTNKVNVKNGISDMHHRVSNGRLITYFEYGLTTTTCEQPIAELVLGPKCAISEHDLKTFLSACGYQRVSYRKSSATYR